MGAVQAGIETQALDALVAWVYSIQGGATLPLVLISDPSPPVSRDQLFANFTLANFSGYGGSRDLAAAYLPAIASGAGALSLPPLQTYGAGDGSVIETVTGWLLLNDGQTDWIAGADLPAPVEMGNIASGLSFFPALAFLGNIAI